MAEYQKKALLVMINGLGFSTKWSGNVLAMNQGSNFDRLIRDYPSFLLKTFVQNAYDTSPDLSMANVSSGRRNPNRKEQIDSIIKSNGFDSDALRKMVNSLRESGTACHLIGTIDEKEYFSSINHLKMIVNYLNDNHIANVYLHLIVAGDESSQRFASYKIGKLIQFLKEAKIGEIATICGSDYLSGLSAQRKDTEVIQNIVLGKGERVLDLEASITNYYKSGIFDRSLPPISVCRRSKPIGAINDFDSVLLFDLNNFFTEKIKFSLSAKSILKSVRISHLNVVSLIENDSVDQNISDISFYQTVSQPNLPSLLSENCLNQLFVSEMISSYSVNRGFNGFRPLPYPLAKWKIAPSVSDFEYTKKPSLSSSKICEIVTQAMAEKSHDFILCDFCNLELFTQFSSIGLASAAFGYIDECLAKLEKISSKNGYTMFVASSHGGAEEIKSTDKNGYMKFSDNPVPFIIVNKSFRNNSVKGNFSDLLNTQYSIYDIAPTILKFFNISQPKEFQGESLII